MRKELKIGIFVVLAIAAAVFGINFLKGKDLLGTNQVYHIEYDYIDGLLVSNPVMFSGLKVGSVKSIKLDPSTHKIKVDVNITNSDLQLPKGTIARITSSDLLGSKAVILNLGNSKDVLKPGEYLVSDIDIGLQEQVNQQLAPLKNKAEGLISSIDSIVVIATGILNEGSVQDIQSGLKSITTALEAFAGAAQEIDTIITSQREALENTLGHLESATGIIDNKKEDLGRIITNVAEISDSLAHSNLPKAISQLELALEESTTLLNKMNNGEGSLGLLLKTDSLHDAMMINMHEVELLLKDVQARPGRYLSFPIIGRKEKGLILSPSEEKKLKTFLNK